MLLYDCHGWILKMLIRLSFKCYLRLTYFTSKPIRETSNYWFKVLVSMEVEVATGNNLQEGSFAVIRPCYSHLRQWIAVINSPKLPKHYNGYVPQENIEMCSKWLLPRVLNCWLQMMCPSKSTTKQTSLTNYAVTKSVQNQFFLHFPSAVTK